MQHVITEQELLNKVKNFPLHVVFNYELSYYLIIVTVTVTVTVTVIVIVIFIVTVIIIINY